jgi:protein-S-isoprenylcysteine O-methyltransferase Ste14
VTSLLQRLDSVSPAHVFAVHLAAFAVLMAVLGVSCAIEAEWPSVAGATVTALACAGLAWLAWRDR